MILKLSVSENNIMVSSIGCYMALADDQDRALIGEKIWKNDEVCTLIKERKYEDDSVIELHINEAWYLIELLDKAIDITHFMYKDYSIVSWCSVEEWKKVVMQLKRQFYKWIWDKKKLSR